MDVTLSQELRIHADQLKREYVEDLPPDEQHEQIETQAFVDNITKLIVFCRESLTHNDFAKLEPVVEGHREVIERSLDEHYTLRQLEVVPTLVRRTLRLSHLNARDTPSKQTNRYISEASRAFILGLPLASIAMSRAALEQGLKEKLGYQGTGAYIEFKELLGEAAKRSVLSSAGREAARKLARRCNGVLHEEPLKGEESAIDILAGVRSLLEELFGTDAKS